MSGRLRSSGWLMIGGCMPGELGWLRTTGYDYIILHVVLIGGEWWMTARESCARAGLPQDLDDMKERGRRAATLARSQGLMTVDAPAPPWVTWATEHCWPERIWIEVAWDLWYEANCRSRVTLTVIPSW